MEKNNKHTDETVMEGMVPPVNGAIEKAKEMGNEYMKMAQEKGESIWNNARAKSRKTWGSAKSLIQKHPVKAMGYAVLFGFTVAAIAALLIPKGEKRS